MDPVWWHCTFLNAIKTSMFCPVYILNITEFSSIVSAWLSASLATCCKTWLCYGPNFFYKTKVISLDLQSKLLLRWMFIHCSMVFPLLHFIAFIFKSITKRMRNLYIGVDKLVEKMSINLLHYTKINVTQISHLCKQHNYWCACCYLCHG